MKKINYKHFYLFVIAAFVQGCSHIPFMHKNEDTTLNQESASPSSTADFKQTVRSNKIKPVTQVDIANDYYKSLVTENYVLNNLEMYNKLENLIKKSMTFKNGTAPETESTADTPAQADNTEVTASATDEQKPQRHLASVKNAKALDESSYKIKNGDTLMKIAFERYGDLTRWREIYSDNQQLLGQHFSLIQPGLIIKLRAGSGISISRNGKPYLILKNETLSLISNKLYGQSRYWSSLWHNNPELISNPNKIYSGFTLYYLGLDQIKPASLSQSKKNSNSKVFLNTTSKSAEKSDLPSLKNENRIPANLKEE